MKIERRPSEPHRNSLQSDLSVDGEESWRAGERWAAILAEDTGDAARVFGARGSGAAREVLFFEGEGPDFEAQAWWEDEQGAELFLF